MARHVRLPHQPEVAAKIKEALAAGYETAEDIDGYTWEETDTAGRVHHRSLKALIEDRYGREALLRQARQNIIRSHIKDVVDPVTRERSYVAYEQHRLPFDLTTLSDQRRAGGEQQHFIEVEVARRSRVLIAEALVAGRRRVIALVNKWPFMSTDGKAEIVRTVERVAQREIDRLAG